jgi:DNA (cytosine-5)-methyltransferase 1
MDLATGAGEVLRKVLGTAHGGQGVMTRDFTIGSLFSGIDGLALGLEWAGLGPTVWQVESNPNARKVLAQHWPEARRYDDVRTVGAANLAAVGLICGGFPCQDVSSAGARVGLQGARSGLWFEFERIVGELCPAWVVVENVASGAALWVDTVCGGLERLGYACLPIPLAARDVGAPHRRERVFVVAHAHDEGEPTRAEHGQMVGARSTARHASDALQSRRQGHRPQAHEGRPGLAPHVGWQLERGLVPLVHGVSSRLSGRARREQIRLLGNSVVPQCAEVVGWVIRELAGEVAA